MPHPRAGLLAIVVLLAACAGGPAQQNPGKPDPALHTSVLAARAAVDTGRFRLHAMTAREVMLEWGTRRTGEALPTLADAPYQSIDQILGSETCLGCESRPYHKYVLAASRRHRVPASLIHAVIRKESGYKARATSSRHARGLMQITPQTGRFLGVKQARLYDPGTNIEAGTAYLKYLMGQYDSVDEVLAAYNAGAGNVRKYNGVPPFAETRQYVRDVKRDVAATAGPLGEPQQAAN